MTRESLEIILRLWPEDAPFAHKGQYWTVRKPELMYATLKPRFGHWVIFDHCLPFDVSRAYDEATDHRDPRIWTAQRDKDMWQALEG